jgi:hypothetical protein
MELKLASAMPAGFANEFAFSIFITREVHALGANFSRVADFLIMLILVLIVIVEQN